MTLTTAPTGFMPRAAYPDDTVDAQLQLQGVQDTLALLIPEQLWQKPMSMGDKRRAARLSRWLASCHPLAPPGQLFRPELTVGIERWDDQLDLLAEFRADQIWLAHAWSLLGALPFSPSPMSDEFMTMLAQAVEYLRRDTVQGFLAPLPGLTVTSLGAAEVLGINYPNIVMQAPNEIAGHQPPARREPPKVWWAITNWLVQHADPIQADLQDLEERRTHRFATRSSGSSSLLGPFLDQMPMRAPQ